jgi:thioesterase domain-containing protein
LTSDQSEQPDAWKVSRIIVAARGEGMNFTPETVKELVEKKIAFVERMGLKVIELTPGYVKLIAPLQGNENHVGSMYAGALFTLAEIPGGALILTTFDPTKCFPVIKELTIKFLRPAASDITTEMFLSRGEVDRITAEVTEKGKADFVLHGELKDQTGTVVAVSQGLYQIRLTDKAWAQMDR